MNNQPSQLNQSNISQESEPSFDSPEGAVPSGQPEMPKKFGLPTWVSVLMIVVAAIIVVSLITWAAYRAFISSPAELLEEEKQVSPLPLTGENTPADETANWQTYRNERLGFSFKYPRKYGEVEFSINIGETGEIFQGYFSNSNRLRFGGITRDFSAGRGGSFLDTQGYIKDNNKYFFKFVNDKKIEITPSMFISMDEGKDKALIIENQSIDLLIGPSSKGALINLKNNKFSGLAFYYSNIPESDINIFDGIISTFKFIE